MSKKTIGTLYLVSLVLEILSTILLVGALPQAEQGYTSQQDAIKLLLVLMVLFAIPAVIGWIGALVNLARAQEWVWFFLVLLFSGIGMLIYLVAGPPPKGARQALPAQSWAAAPPLADSPGGLAYPPGLPLSALEILQQRYARGEIDTATYDEMRARLEGRA